MGRGRPWQAASCRGCVLIGCCPLGLGGFPPPQPLFLTAGTPLCARLSAAWHRYAPISPPSWPSSARVALSRTAVTAKGEPLLSNNPAPAFHSVSASNDLEAPTLRVLAALGAAIRTIILPPHTQATVPAT